MNKYYGYISHLQIGSNEITLDKPFDAFEKIATAPRERVREVFKKYNIILNDRDLDKTIEIMGQYYKDRTIRLYDILPKSVKNGINQICRNLFGIGFKNNINRDVVAQDFFEHTIRNMGCELSLMELSDDTILQAKEMRDNFNAMYSDIFNSIEDIRTEDPERAALIERVKVAFAEAEGFSRQINYMNNDIPKNVRRYYMHFNSEITEFNKKVNVTPVRIHDINQVYNFLRNQLPREFTTDELKGFIVLICRSTMNLDFSDIVNVAYVYRLLDNIMKYHLIPDESLSNMLDNVKDVIIQLRGFMNYSRKGNR